MFTCSKTYADVPFAHRQHKHPGHCAFVHGHNWTFTFTFGCRELDGNGFVVDFGSLKYIRGWLDEHLDHACVFNRDDPLRETLAAAAPSAWKPYVVDCCSAEGIARHLFDEVGALVAAQTGGRAFVTAVRVDEDARNSATYAADSDNAAAAPRGSDAPDSAPR